MAFATVAAASPHEYIALTGDLIGLGDCDGDDVSFGMVCFPAGHVGVDADGRFSYSIDDDVNRNAGGRICEDLNANALCGDDGDVAIQFCSSVSLATEASFLFIEGVIFGNPVLSPCSPIGGFGTHGFVNHS